MALLIMDSNVLNLIQPGEFLDYVTALSEVECVPARLAREEAEARLADRFRRHWVKSKMPPCR